MDTRNFSAAERLERLPLSGYHRVIFIIIALAFFFDSMDLAMMTFLLGSIKAEFGLSSAQAGLLASSSFFGMVVGASLSGCSPTASGASRCSSGASCCGAWPVTCVPRRKRSRA
jgi:MFS family permease